MASPWQQKDIADLWRCGQLLEAPVHEIVDAIVS